MAQEDSRRWGGASTKPPRIPTPWVILAHRILNGSAEEKTGAATSLATLIIEASEKAN